MSMSLSLQNFLYSILIKKVLTVHRFFYLFYPERRFLTGKELREITAWDGSIFFLLKKKLKKKLIGKDLIFVVATSGEGISSGASPEVARLSKELGAFTIALVSMPFLFKGKMGYNLAKKGLQKLRKHPDAIIIIDNNQIIELPDKYIEKAC